MTTENTDPQGNNGAEGGDPPQGGAQPPAAQPSGNSGGSPPAGTPSAEQMLQMTSEQLKERLTRAQMSYLQEQFGTKDPAEVKAKLQQLKDLEEAEEKRKREQLSKEEQLQADLDAERARAAAAQEERDAIAFENHITRVCAEMGVKNVDYAMWEVARQADTLPEGEQLDAREHLKKLLDNDQSRAALGVAPPVEVEERGATTDPTGGSSEPGAGGSHPPKGEDAFEMTKENWAAKKARLGIQ